MRLGAMHLSMTLAVVHSKMHNGNIDQDIKLASVLY